MHAVPTFYLYSIGFGYVAPISSEGYEHLKVEIKIFDCLLVEVEYP